MHNGNTLTLSKYSPSDLVRFVKSPFASWMARHEIEVPDSGIKRDPQSPLMAHLAELGAKHEASVGEAFASLGLRVVTIDPESRNEDAKYEKTLAVMAEGADVICQALLRKPPFRGYADFLVRCDEPSKLGNYSYEVWDAKLAREVKPEFAVQLCCYSEMLEAMQGLLPKYCSVALGNNKQERLEVSEYFYFYLDVKDKFLAQQADFDARHMPDPFKFADHSDWSGYVERFRQERDHLSKVANIRRDQIAKLERAGIKTMSALAKSRETKIPKLNADTFTTLKKQAAMQIETERSGTPSADLRKPREGTVNGLAYLPPHHPADLFWDLEGYPLEDGGLEYLWGCVYRDRRGKTRFWERWAHDHDQEKQAFSDFILWAHDRWRANPGMHIYHYAHYEIVACTRLMGRYGVCESQLDELLRNKVFVDLFKIVRRGLVVGTPSYSIKDLEQFYDDHKRDTSVTVGDDSVAEYGRWREVRDGDTWETSEILCSIREYNKKDCESTLGLAQWLRKIRDDAGIPYQKRDKS